MDFLEITGHEYILALYGVIGWYLILFSIQRNRANNKLTFAQWRHNNLDEILVTVWIAPLLVIFDDETIALIEKYAGDYFDTDEFHYLVYLLAGPATDAVYRIINLFRKNGHKN